MRGRPPKKCLAQLPRQPAPRVGRRSGPEVVVAQAALVPGLPRVAHHGVAVALVPYLVHGRVPPSGLAGCAGSVVLAVVVAYVLAPVQQDEIIPCLFQNRNASDKST